MSQPDLHNTPNPVSDAEFDAFLRGEGELADALRQLPQAEPSAESDAAILAFAKEHVRTQPPSDSTSATTRQQGNAANDDTHPGAMPFRRIPHAWSYGFGLAASIVLGVSLLLYRGLPTDQPTPGHPKPADLAEQTPAAQAKPAAAPAQLAQLAQNDAVQRQAAPETSKAAERAAPAAAPSSAKPQVNAPAKAEHKREAPTALAKVDQTQQVEPVEPAAAGAPPVALAKADQADEQRARVTSVAPQTHTEEAIRPAPVAAAPAAPPAAGVASTDTSPAKAWLETIEAMIDAGLKRDAREEWKKFQRAYPDYQPSPKLQAKLKTLDR
ncbi:hypothetical protein [Andreprevotia chitinilytica]|uniref:hypothetical protein n=1 Tax=Andreprevotia chitinilytica TaxID=396808 RepID=UPI00054F122F|nr:hypothetical protein [Andreprevotia chitinilytica]